MNLGLAYDRIKKLWGKLGSDNLEITREEAVGIMTRIDPSIPEEAHIASRDCQGTSLTLKNLESVTNGTVTHELIHTIAIHNQTTRTDLILLGDFEGVERTIKLKRKVSQVGIRLESCDTIQFGNFAQNKEVYEDIVNLLSSNQLPKIKEKYPTQYHILNNFFDQKPGNKEKFMLGIIQDWNWWDEDIQGFGVQFQMEHFNGNFNEAITVLLTIFADNPSGNFALPTKQYTDAGYHHEPWMQALLNKYKKLNNSDRLELIKLLHKAITTEHPTVEFEDISYKLASKYFLEIDNIESRGTHRNNGEFIEVPKEMIFSNNLLIGVFASSLIMFGFGMAKWDSRGQIEQLENQIKQERLDRNDTNSLPPILR